MLFWECRESSIWFNQTAELDSFFNNKHTEEQIPQDRRSNGHFSKNLLCSFHRQALRQAVDINNLKCSVYTRSFISDGRMRSKQKFLNNIMIQITMAAQGIITQVRLEVEKWLLEEAIQSESCILSRVYPRKDNGEKYSK